MLRVSGSLPTITNARHGQTLCSHTLRAAFHGATRYTTSTRGRKRLCPHALALYWHRGHTLNPHDRGVRLTLDGATAAARCEGPVGGS